MALTYPIWWIVTDSSLMLSQAAMKERMGASGGPYYYPPEQQSKIDQRCLNYDEFLATADRAFGAFIADLENSRKLGNTTLIVSADHGGKLRRRCLLARECLSDAARCSHSLYHPHARAEG